MGSLQAQNLTWGATEPEIAHWEPTEHQPPAVNNIITVLGVLTFGLQLCLVLFFVFRCQRLDNKMQEVLKQANTASKGAALSSLHRNMQNLKQASDQQCNKDSSSSLLVPVASLQHMNAPPLFAPPIPWDLVQG